VSEEELTIPARFNGPAGSANGGITCGLLARATGLSEVTLRVPPPLEVPLRVEGTSLYDGDVLVAQAGPGVVDVAAAPAVTVAEAEAVGSSYLGLQEHPFPTCFVCGPAHPTGLHLTPGRVGDGRVAAVWVPEEADPVFVWAALDCPSGWATDIVGRPAVLGRMACRVDALPVAGAPHVVVGWQRGEDGRKLLTGSALYDAAGTLLAVAQQTWIALA
jgi:hypothetical protein